MSSVTPEVRVARGLGICPTCGCQSLTRTDTRTNDIPWGAGVVVREQVYVCIESGCDEIVKVDSVCRGRFAKRSLGR